MLTPSLILRRLAMVLALGSIHNSVYADDAHAEQARRGHQHDEARAALQQGAILPIIEILKRVALEVPGEVIEVELERGDQDDGARWIYELKIITPDGRRREVIVDGTNGRLLEQEED